MKEITLILPHQILKDTSLFPKTYPVYLVEESLFFQQYAFHKQKLCFHRASMQCYQNYLTEQGFDVHYIEAHDERSDVRVLLTELIEEGLEELHVIDPTDNWLEQRIRSFEYQIAINWQENPLFLNTKQELSSFFKPDKQKFYQTSFYKEQRKQRNILLENGEPAGGKWTYDSENRKAFPKNKNAPAIHFPELDAYQKEAREYVQTHFSDNPGTLDGFINYPVSFEAAEAWLEQFLEYRFYAFGDYEDAIVSDANILYHSVLSPLINTGLLTVEEVLEQSLTYAREHDIPINSLEGFVRQLIGWREFIRGVYEVKGSQQRTTNFWQHQHAMPKALYDGSTGIAPVDQTIQKVLQTGYAHHIERLMVLSNFMVLCEIDPDAVYQWFMELFIDAYDWVMVPNVYGMSLFSDGGLMSTKPYISSSNYIRKMSDYAGGDWEKVWDGLFWRFMDKHRNFFAKNHRMNLLVANFDKMDAQKRSELLETAEHFLKNLHKK